MSLITLSIVNHPAGGYALEFPDKKYQTENIDNTDIDKATQFPDYIAICAFIEGSWPAFSTWSGKWIDNTHYSIEAE